MKKTELIFILSLTAATLLQAQVSEIKKSLICTCDCGMTVSACEGAMECSTAAKITAKIENLVASGQTNDQVLASFVSMYGEKIMAAPSKKGFNLTAWILPFILIALTGIFLYRKLSKWANSARQVSETKNDHALKPIQQKYVKMLDKELEDYE
ncbi:MAG: hypothetical protein GXO75_01950 [Calditrichaeota bacterium]|nr:hypothetical protein [Calditrichota bacterium]